MIRTLQDRAVAVGVDVHMEVTITHLVVTAGRVTAAYGYRRVDGGPVLFQARAIVLATGGFGRAYSVTSNSWEYSGDGHALAYRAGAELIDMEFVQFHPTGMVWPPGVRGLLVTEAVRGEGGILRNRDGERFMYRYLPPDRRNEYAADDNEARRWVEAQSAGRPTELRRPPELSTRDNVSRAIYTEVKEGRGTEHGGVYLDISYLPADHIRTKLPSMYDQFIELADVDITRVPMEVGPTTHYAMGGVRVDPDTAEATVPGLFAAGEVAGGMHGANRLGGNSLSDLLVFGQRAGAAAAAAAARIDAQPWVDPVQVAAAERELAEPLERSDGEDPYRLREELQATMDSRVGIFRTATDLEAALESIADIARRAERLSVPGGRAFNPAWNLVFELRNLVTVSEAIARSAAARTESRGAHSRLDFPAADPSLADTNVVVRWTGDGMAVEMAPHTPLSAEQEQVIALAGGGG
jgi:succinate dehydrogenase / fumarate reductase flavoprotein subunit